MRRVMCLGALLLASSCDFDEALTAYCAGNPRCPSDGGSTDGGSGGGTGDAGQPDAGFDAGSLTPGDVLFSMSAATSASLAGELVPLQVEALLVDGGALPGGASLTASGGRAALVLSEDGGTGPWSPETPLFLTARPAADPSQLEIYETIVRATLTLPGGAQLNSPGFVHTLRARAHIEGTSSSASSSQYTPFNCVGFNVVLVGANPNQRVAVDAGAAFVTIRRVDAGVPVAMFPSANCTGSPVSNLVVPGPDRLRVSLRLSEVESFTATISEPQYFDPAPWPIHYVPLPVEVAARIDGAVFSGADGGTTNLARDGGSFEDCTPIELYWRHADPRYAPMPITGAVGDSFPFTLSGTFLLYGEPTCTTTPLPVPYTFWSAGGTSAGVTVYLKALGGMAGTTVTVGFPDGGATTTFTIP